MPTMTEQDVSTMKVRLWHAPVAGLVATVVMTMMMYGAAPMMIGKPLDIAAHLGALMGGLWFAGMAAHFVLGTIIFPFIFVLVFAHILPGPIWFRGIFWGFVLWVVAMIVVMPMTGGELFMGGAPPALASLLGHFVYGAVLGGVVGMLNR